MSIFGLVSVILPTFNRANLLPRAINSVLNQSYQDWELLIWNDGSSDDTEKVVKSYDDPRIHLYSEPNRGKPYALNQALKRANGEYIAFLDDDDEWTKEKLTLQVGFLRENSELALVFGNFINVDHFKQKTGLGFEQTASGLEKLTTTEKANGWKVIYNGFLEGLCAENFVAFDTILAQKGLFTSLGGFNELLKSSEDFEFWWRFGLARQLAAYNHDVVMLRNKYPGSLSGGEASSLKNVLDALDVCVEDSHRLGQPQTLRLLRKLYRNQWQNLIRAYGQQGRRSEAFQAFVKSLQYGIQTGSINLLLKIFLTQRVDT